MFHYKSCGLQGIWLRNGYTEIETDYGKAVSIHNLDGLHRAIGLHIVCNTPELSGEEVRFLRKELDMSQVDLATILGVSENSIRGWENSRSRISSPAERLLRTLYREHVDGDGTVRGMVERISRINRDTHWERVEFEEDAAGWQSKVAA